MKQKQSFLFPLLMMIVMMAMSPQRLWAGACGYTPNCAAIEAMTIHKDGTNNNYNGSTNSYVALAAGSSYISTGCATFARQGGTLAGGNNYYYTRIGVDNWNDCSQFSAGELCYKLNGSRSAGTDEKPLAWYQTLTGTGADAYPVLNNSHSIVYQNKYYYCDGTTLKTYYYTNDANASTTDKHEYEAENNTTNGFCHGTPNQEHLQPAGETTISETKYYTIGNAGQLYWFADKVNNENATYKTANAKLTDNIVVNKGTFAADGTFTPLGETEGATPRAWTPIGKGYVDNTLYSFDGTFDGDNHTVSGLYFNNSSAYRVGLAGYMSNPSVIKNVGVVDCYFNSRTVGAICGISFGTIHDCYATGIVMGPEDVGGVCGYNGNIISNCYATVTITGTDDGGGVCGFNNGKITHCYTSETTAVGTTYDGNFANVEGGITTKRFNSGEITWKLNGGKTDGTQVWYQTAGTGYPSLVKAADGSNTIYGLNRNYNNTGKLDVNLTTFDGKKYGAIYTDFPWTIDATDVKAYIAESNTDGVLKMKETTSAPAGTAVIFVGSTDGTASLNFSATATGDKGILSGSDEAVAATGKYLFGRKDGVIGFYTTSAETVAAFKPYLEIASGAKGYRLMFEDEETTSIHNSEFTIQNDGKYLENGKVVIVRNGKKYNVNGQIIK